MTRVRVGTRKSPLALWQANHARALLLAAQPGIEVELVEIVTTGDKVKGALGKAGKGLFVKEIEEALLAGRIDLAVHSAKDVPAELPAGLILAAFCAREDPRDALCAPGAGTLSALRQGARVGTSSPRRASQLRAARPDLLVVQARGNVGTRLARAGAEVDAVVLAVAGLVRLGLRDRVTEVFELERMLPAAGQGALAFETRADDTAARELARAIGDEVAGAAVRAERALVARLGGGCELPVAAHAVVTRGQIALLGFCGAPDGSAAVRGSRSGPAAEAERLGTGLGEELLARGGRRILDDLLATTPPTGEIPES